MCQIVSVNVSGGKRGAVDEDPRSLRLFLLFYFYSFVRPHERPGVVG